MLKVKRISLMLILVGMAMTASASSNPPINQWSFTIGQGNEQYNLYNKNRQSLHISCSDVWGFGVFIFQNEENEISHDDKGVSLSFVLDGKTKVQVANTVDKPPAKFIRGIAKAKKIEVFNNNKKLATFTPSAKSIKAYGADMITSCLKK